MPGRRHSAFQNILVGYDGSVQAEKAAHVAFAMAKAMDCKVLLFAVARPPEPAASVELEAVLDNAKEHYEEAFQKLTREAAESNIDVQTDIAIGHPAEQIIHKAETIKADLVILGRRGMSRFEKWILGSISERVLRYAHCPVMVVR